MAPADFLTEKRNEIAARVKELEPLVAEYHRLEAAAAALDGLPGGGSAKSAPARSPRRSRASAPAPAAKPARKPRGADAPRRGRPKGSGARAAQALALVQASPGITIPEIAEKMGIKQNYLYRVLPGLAEDGHVVKDGRGWNPKNAG